jgi:hypothetical protein
MKNTRFHIPKFFSARRGILFTCTCLLLVSCGKEYSESETEFLTTNLYPGVELTSIDSVQIISNGPWCVDSNIPMPLSGNDSYTMDVDQDGNGDFTITVRHNPTTCIYPPCGEYASYSCILEILGNTCNDSILVKKNESFYEHIIFHEKDTIHLSSFQGVRNWSSLLYGACPPAVSDDLTNCYIGIKKKNFLGWIHLDKIFHGIKVIDFGISIKREDFILIEQIPSE